MHLTRCVFDTQIPPINADSQDGQVHMDKYHDSVTINAHVQNESSNIYFFFVMNNVHFS